MKFSMLVAYTPALMVALTAISAALSHGARASREAVIVAGAVIDVEARTALTAKSLDPDDPNNDAAIYLYQSPDCVTANWFYTVEPTGTDSVDGGCFQLDMFPGPSWDVEAVGAHYLRGSCTVTVYTDEWCSDNPLEISLGMCSPASRYPFKSFSVDGCT